MRRDSIRQFRAQHASEREVRHLRKPNHFPGANDQSIHLVIAARHPDELIAADEPKQNSIAFLKITVCEPRPEQERLAGPMLRFGFLGLRLELSPSLQVRSRP